MWPRKKRAAIVKENMRRFYRMEVWPDLLGGALLMRQWGRIGTEG